MNKQEQTKKELVEKNSIESSRIEFIKKDTLDLISQMHSDMNWAIQSEIERRVRK